MNRGNLTASDYYGLATAYRERARIAVNTDDVEARDHAANLAIQAYQDCVNLQLKSPGYGVDTWKDLGQNCSILSCLYYLAVLTVDRGKGTAPNDLWARTVILHGSVRHYIDFIWTLCLYRVPGLEAHLHIISKVLPEGYHARFDLTILTEGNTPVETKEHIQTILSDCGRKKPPGSAIPFPVTDDEDSMTTWDNRKLFCLANKAISGIMDCVEELTLYMCTVSKRGTNESDLAQGYIQVSEVPCPPMITCDSTDSQCPPLDDSSAHVNRHHTPQSMHHQPAEEMPRAAAAPPHPIPPQQNHMGYHPPPGQYGQFDQYKF